MSGHLLRIHGCRQIVQMLKTHKQLLISKKDLEKDLLRFELPLKHCYAGPAVP